MQIYESGLKFNEVIQGFHLLLLVLLFIMYVDVRLMKMIFRYEYCRPNSIAIFYQLNLKMRKLAYQRKKIAGEIYKSNNFHR